MNSKPEQLFLELCVLALRYTGEDIELLSNVRLGSDRNNVASLLAALREIRAAVADKPSLPSKMATRKKAAGAFRKKAGTASRDDKSNTEPFVNLANSLMRK